MTNPFRIVGVADPDERPVLIAAAENFVGAISAAAGDERTVELAFAEHGAPPPSGAHMVILSLRGEVGASASMDAVATRWNDWLGVLLAEGRTQVVIGTIYRHVADSAPGTVERIRRLNALAIMLSRTHAVEVADIDRACALVGNRIVGGDWRSTTGNAAAIAGHVIASALLRLDLSAYLADDAGDRARAAHGPLNAMIERLEGR